MPDWRRSLRAALFLRAVVKGTARIKADTLALLNRNQEDIASELKIAQPSANQAMQAAGWSALETFLGQAEYR